jgi:uncharacterized protein with HEPN domain
MDKSTTLELIDFISHHYIDLDAEAVYDICKNDLVELEEKIFALKQILEK